MAVVVGRGAVTPLGHTLATSMDRLLAGEGAIGPITRFDASSFPVNIGAEGPRVHRADGSVEDEAVALCRAWLGAALDQGLDGVDLDPVPPARRGVFLGAEASRPPVDQLVAALDGKLAPAETVRAHAPWALVRETAERAGALGPAAVLSTACTSSGQAVGEALLAIERGEVDVAIAAGVDMLVHPLMLAGFARLGALSTRNDAPERASRPFDLDRDGFVLGEGAGVVVLASERVAGQVGPRLGRVSGYGCSSNAWRITDSPPDGRGALEAMEAALDHAGVGRDGVAWVHAHGTSTKQNDQSEAAAIRRALGGSWEQTPVSSTKGAMGHLVAACGVVGVAIAVEALARGQAPATRNLERPDPQCQVRHVQPGEGLRLGAAVVNAFGFGGVNASVVVEGA